MKLGANAVDDFFSHALYFAWQNGVHQIRMRSSCIPGKNLMTRNDLTFDNDSTKPQNDSTRVTFANDLDSNLTFYDSDSTRVPKQWLVYIIELGWDKMVQPKLRNVERARKVCSRCLNWARPKRDIYKCTMSKWCETLWQQKSTSRLYLHGQLVSRRLGLRHFVTHYFGSAISAAPFQGRPSSSYQVSW